MKIKTSQRSGFTLLEFVAVLATIATLAALLLPVLHMAYAARQKNACIENLKLIEIAKTSFVRENQITNNTALSLWDTKNMSHKPVCPAGGVYIIGAVGAKPTCSIPGHAIPEKTP